MTADNMAKNKILMLKVLKELTGKGSVIQSLGDDSDILHHRRSTQFSDDSQKDRKEDETQSLVRGESTTLVKKPDVPRTIILHYSPFKAVWDWITLLLVLYTAVFTPYMAAFNEEKPSSMLRDATGDGGQGALNASSVDGRGSTGRPTILNVAFTPMNVIDMVVDIMFLADILINFRTTYLHNGEVVVNPRKIAYNYVRGWFIIDAIAAVPFDLLLKAAGTNDAMPVMGVLKTARLLRLLRVARRIDQYSEYGGGVLLLLMATFTLIAHWLACLFYAVTNIERTRPDVPPGWLEALAEKNNLPNVSSNAPDIRTRYITALYFTFTILTSVGFGNVAPVTNYEKIFTIFAMLLGSLICAAIFGNVSSIMLRLYRGTEEYHEMLTSIKEFIKFHYIPKALGNRLLESYQHTRSFANGVDMNSVLKSFPDCLQADICLHLNHNLLSSCPAFRQASPGCLRALSLKFKSTHAPPGDTMIHPGDILDSIYFIARGSIEIVDDEIVMAILGKDDVFGEDLKKSYFDPRRTVSKSGYTVRAMSYSDMHRIRIDDLQSIMDSYSEFATDFLQKFGVTFNLKKEASANAFKGNTEMMEFIKLRRRKSYFPEECHHKDHKDSCFQTVPQIKKSIRRMITAARHRSGSTIDISYDDDRSSSIVELSPEYANPAPHPALPPALPSVPDELFNQVSSRKSSRVSSTAARPSLEEAYSKPTEADRKRQSFTRTVKTLSYQGQGPCTLPARTTWTAIEEDDDQALPEDEVTTQSHGGLSPIASRSSSMTYAPKSSPSTGLPSGQSPLESEGVTMKYLCDIDDRLKAITQRMGNFEDDLCKTVDAILEVLGYEPQVARRQVATAESVYMASAPTRDLPNLLSFSEDESLLMLP